MAREARCSHSFARPFPPTLSTQKAGRFSRIEGTYITLPSILAAWQRNPNRAISWNVYKIAAKAVLLRAVEATDHAAEVAEAAAEFKVLATTPMASQACLAIGRLFLADRHNGRRCTADTLPTSLPKVSGRRQTTNQHRCFVDHDQTLAKRIGGLPGRVFGAKVRV